VLAGRQGYPPQFKQFNNLRDVSKKLNKLSELATSAILDTTPRSARLDAPGILNHVIIRGIERKDIFRDTIDQEKFVDRLSQLVPRTQTSHYAWVLMSNHAHFLFRSGRDWMAWRG
jgi:hypothetical protein